MVQNIDFKANICRRYKTNVYFVLALISERGKREADFVALSWESFCDAGDGGVF
jgi:hypothetical protein